MLSNLSLVGIVVVVGQLIAGLSLVSGRFLGIGLLVGLFMNVNFLAAGAVNPSAFYLVMQGALGLWLLEQRGQRASTFTYLRAVSIVLGGLGLGSLPYVSTLHPAKVTDDPAIMLILTALLALVAAATAHHQLSARQASAPWPTRSIRTSPAPLIGTPIPGPVPLSIGQTDPQLPSSLSLRSLVRSDQHPTTAM